jgi:hypothetical protein
MAAAHRIEPLPVAGRRAAGLGFPIERIGNPFYSDTILC